LSISFYIALAFTVAGLGAWVMALRQRHAPTSQTLALNLAPLAAAWMVLLLRPPMENANDTFYKGAILLGLLLAIIGIALRESKFLPGYVAHAHLVLTYTLYAYAFTSQSMGWPTPFALLLIGAAGAIFYWLYPTLAELWSSVAIYVLLILLATWQALEIATQQPQRAMGWAALAGMLLVTVAMLLEAQARFRIIRPAWAWASLPIFLLAQFAIAWSAWG
jgi:uncharacterized membrane protein YhhN